MLRFIRSVLAYRTVAIGMSYQGQLWAVLDCAGAMYRLVCRTAGIGGFESALSFAALRTDVGFRIDLEAGDI
jgi:hypothetical protein